MATDDDAPRVSSMNSTALAAIARPPATKPATAKVLARLPRWS
jgi:hypothetical protein